MVCETQISCLFVKILTLVEVDGSRTVLIPPSCTRMEKRATPRLRCRLRSQPDLASSARGDTRWWTRA